MDFASDNVYGAHEAIAAAVARASTGAARPYGGDDHVTKARQRLCEVFERQVEVFFVATGTAANALGLAAVTPDYGAVLCHEEAHILVDECGAVTQASGGAEMLGIAGAGGKLTREGVEARLTGLARGVHDPLCAALSITQASELGTVYTLDEITGLTELCRRRGMAAHMDGARFANALVSLGCAPADMTWRAGIDVLSFGCTKNGALMLDAVLFFKPEQAQQFERRQLRAGHLVSKARFIGAQMIAYLEDDLWLRNAAHANAMASRLAQGLEGVPGVRLPLPCQANAIFPILPKRLHEELHRQGAVYHLWPGAGPGTGEIAPDEVFARLVTSFATSEQQVDEFVETAKAAAGMDMVAGAQARPVRGPGSA